MVAFIGIHERLEKMNLSFLSSVLNISHCVAPAHLAVNLRHFFTLYPRSVCLLLFVFSLFFEGMGWGILFLVIFVLLFLFFFCLCSIFVSLHFPPYICLCFMFLLHYFLLSKIFLIFVFYLFIYFFVSYHGIFCFPTSTPANTSPSLSLSASRQSL